MKSDNEREAESAANASKSQEPTMEEILASIRAIIADDRAKGQRPAPPPAAPQVIYSNFGKAPEPAIPTIVWSRPEEPPLRPATEPLDDPADFDEAPYAHAALSVEPDDVPADLDDGPLLSLAADREVAAQFQALSATLSAPDPRRIEEMTRELLRPLLKAWLDDNLPSLVERLVKAEIQRVARGGR